SLSRLHQLDVGEEAVVTCSGAGRQRGAIRRRAARLQRAQLHCADAIGRHRFPCAVHRLLLEASSAQVVANALAGTVRQGELDRVAGRRCGCRQLDVAAAALHGRAAGTEKKRYRKRDAHVYSRDGCQTSEMSAEWMCQRRCSGVAPSTLLRRSVYVPSKRCCSPLRVVARITTGTSTYCDPAAPSMRPGAPTSTVTVAVFSKPRANSSYVWPLERPLSPQSAYARR